MNRAYIKFVAAAFTCAVPLSAQQLPPGTRSAEELVSARVRSAERALEQKDYAAAEQLLRPLAQERPKDPRVLYDLGFAQEHLGNDDDASASYKAAITVSEVGAAGAPADGTQAAQARLALGLLDARHNRTAEARQELQAVAGNASAAPELRARALRGVARLDVNEHPEEAAQEILQAIALTGETPADTALSGEAALRAGDLPAAERQLVKALAADPSSLDARLNLAVTLRREGKLSDAEAALRPALSAAAPDPRTAALLADILGQESKPQEAIAVLEKLRSTDPAAQHDADLTAMQARLDSVAGRDTEAEALLRQALAARPGDPALLDALGSALVRQAKYPDAQQTLTEAVRKRAQFHDDRAWAEAASHLAFAAERNHQPQLALQALAARATVLPDSPASLFLEATAHDALHHTSDARRLYRAFLASAGGKFPDEEFEARHRLIALDHAK